LLLLSVFACALLSAQSYLNLSFENASGGVPTGWSSYSAASSYQFAVDTTTAVDGAQSLRISSRSAATNQNGIEYLYLPADPAVGKTLHLSGYIRTQTINSYATLWASANGPTSQIASRDLGSVAPRGTTAWQRYDLYLAVPAGAVSLDFGAVLNGSGTAWFDSMSIDVNGQPFFSSPTAQQVQWIQANAIPFTSLDPEASLAELEPLKNIIGNAHIVGLGEATHGTSEIWRMKTRLLSFLVQEMGFTILAMEAQMPEAARLNDYIQTGIGDPRELLKGMNYFNWNMQEILDMVEWMRRYNASGKGRIQYMGLDVNMANVAMENVIAFVRKADSNLLASVESSYALVGPLQLPGGNPPDLSRDQEGLAAARSVLGQLQANRDKYLRQMSAAEVDWAIQNATIAVQSVQVSLGNIAGDYSVRDAAMAANAEWIAAHAPPGSRIVLWMHNGHINKEPGALGGILAQHFGSDYLTVGTSFHSGMYFACAPLGSGCPGVPPAVMGDFPALDSFPGSAEYFFHQTGTPRQILDLRLADANNPASSWLMSELEFRSIGFAEVDGFLEFNPTSRLAQDFDALVFFDQTSAATELPNGPMDLTVLAPVAPLCGSLDVPYLQAPATGIGAPVSLPDGRAGVAYSQVLEAGGGVCSAWPNTVPLACPTGVWPLYGNWTVIEGALPAGLTLSPDGVVSGTPVESGFFTFTVMVSDRAFAETALGQLSLTIDAGLARGRRRENRGSNLPACRAIPSQR
jgi:erythromycin esterase